MTVVPEIGQFALILALVMAVAQCVLGLFGAARGDRRWMEAGRAAAQSQFIFVAIAFGCLAYSFVTSDFSVLNVASNSNTLLPMNFKFAATWGSHEGSLLLWSLILALWTVAVTVFSDRLPAEVRARVLGVMGFVSIGFLLFMLTTSNPFVRLIPAAVQGEDLNPLLQDPAMVIHPPMLYMGYVGFSVAFAFAIAALIDGKLDATWARWSRPWTTAAWCFLTLGVALGSAWAYYELGWGGWWFWDPVENASFMPWLVGTALIHSLAVTEKRGSLKNWTVLLAIATFALSLLGAFLVRSGVLTSVHAFATDPKRGVFLLSFLAVVIGGAFALYAWRTRKVGLGGKFNLISRESFLLSNNVLLVVTAASVLLGTLYPIFVDALGLGKLSVGPPYFNSVFVPLAAPIAVMIGIGPAARWRKQSLPELGVRLRWAFAASVLTAVLLPFVMGEWKWMVSLGLLLAAWIITTVVLNLWKRLGGPTVNGTLFGRFKAQSRSYYGMQIAHLGVAAFIVGVTLVTGYEERKDVRMNVGDTTSIGGYDFKFNGVREVKGPNYVADRGEIEVSRNGEVVEIMRPEKRSYVASTQLMTEAAISNGITGDLYSSLGEPVSNGAWSVSIFTKPFVVWIWGGAALMALGGAVAVSDRRYRVAVRERRRSGMGGEATAPNAAPTMVPSVVEES